MSAELLKYLFSNYDLPARKLAFESLKVIVKWAAFSRYLYNNPALQELLELREVYGNTEQERLLDLVADLLIALDHIKQHLGFAVDAVVEEELRKLPTASSNQTTVTALCDLELDSIWEFDILQRNKNRKPAPPVYATPLDAFFQSEVAPAADEVPAPETQDPKSEETFSKVYKLSQRKGATNPVMDLLDLGDEG
jgi:hypothetical protein